MEFTETVFQPPPDLHISDDAFHNLIEKGWRSEAYLSSTIATLDRMLHVDVDQTAQIEDKRLNTTLFMQWSETIATGPTRLFFRTIAPALSSLDIGHRNWSRPRNYLKYRKVNAEVMPGGPNIPVSLARHTLGGRYDMMLNIQDGVIIITHIQRPQNCPNADIESLSVANGEIESDRWLRLCDVVGAMFSRLHGRHWGKEPEHVAATNAAKVTVAECVKSGSAIPALPKGIVDAWLPVAIARRRMLSQPLVYKEMSGWLNYILVYIPTGHQAEAVINRCLLPLGLNVRTTPPWGQHLTFRIGHWNYFALLASDIGEEIVTLLARRKALESLGHKTIKSITIFHASPVQGISDPEVVQYNTPMMLFEIGDVNEDSVAERRNNEIAWTENPASNCHYWFEDWSQENVGMAHLAGDTGTLQI